MEQAAVKHSHAELRARYEEEGYLVFPEFLDDVELAVLRGALTELLDEAAGLTESNEKFSIVLADDDARPVVRRIRNPIAHHPAFFDLVFNAKIVDVVEHLIGPDIQLHHTKVNLKPPSRDARFEWHQDYPFFPHTNFDLLAVMIMLDDATEENGCLKIIPGSHKEGPHAHVFGRSGAVSSHLADTDVLQDTSLWKNIPLAAGGMELHHCNLLHSSEPNRSPLPRSAMVIQYRAADSVQLGGSTNHYGLGMQIRGSDPHRVRMVEGSFPLPVISNDPLQRSV
jgi:ectoine hydroxylase-related dioxygenase (phytanoyl-CoA dioxygenase family)